MYKKHQTRYSAVIGRFQPFHNGHKQLVENALTECETLCIVLGSARTAPSVKNPWTPAMREKMIRACFSIADNAKIKFVAVRDYTYNLNMWLTDVRAKVLSALDCEDHEVKLIGHFKDESSFYLKMFPNWVLEDIPPAKLTNATSIRDHFLSTAQRDKLDLTDVPKPVKLLLMEYRDSEEYRELAREYDYIKSYKAQWNGPYDPHFICTDAVVVQSGHVLVIKRGRHPGKGLMALPGGFIQKGKTLQETMLSELKEETKIMMPRHILEAHIVEHENFDHPTRSLRGRTVTTAFLIQLPDNLDKGLPRVKGGDDASEAFWMPIGDLGLLEDSFFEDHAHIIRYFIRRM